MRGHGSPIVYPQPSIYLVPLSASPREWPEAQPYLEGDLAGALELAAEAKGSGFVFVIDEWDCPMREAADDEALQRRWLDFLRGLFKGAPYVDAAYMTGVLPIKKCGRHSALNLFLEYTVVDPKDLAELVGFDADEVRRLCARFGMDYAQMERWYDGYFIGSGEDAPASPGGRAQVGPARARGGEPDSGPRLPASPARPWRTDPSRLRDLRRQDQGALLPNRGSVTQSMSVGG